MKGYEKTEGQRVQYLELSTGNHYAISDWNPVSAPHQVRGLLVCQHPRHAIINLKSSCAPCLVQQTGTEPVDNVKR